jgi:hypothetical protein
LSLRKERWWVAAGVPYYRKPVEGYRHKIFHVGVLFWKEGKHWHAAEFRTGLTIPIYNALDRKTAIDAVTQTIGDMLKRKGVTFQEFMAGIPGSIMDAIPIHKE